VTDGLRERKKAATRLALHEAVLRLTLEHGLDSVTVEAVADEARVSRRTFSNYFASKEDAILYGDRVHMEQLLAAVHAQPAEYPPWQALMRGVRAYFIGRPDDDPKRMTQLRLVRRHPSLLGQFVAAQSAFESELTDEITARSREATDGGLRARVMAAAFLAALRTAFVFWAEEQTPSSMRDTILTALDGVGEQLV
jgi:AcrR family transcriptional regulator